MWLKRKLIALLVFFAIAHAFPKSVALLISGLMTFRTLRPFAATVKQLTGRSLILLVPLLTPIYYLAIWAALTVTFALLPRTTLYLLADLAQVAVRSLWLACRLSPTFAKISLLLIRVAIFVFDYFVLNACRFAALHVLPDWANVAKKCSWLACRLFPPFCRVAILTLDCLVVGAYKFIPWASYVAAVQTVAAIDTLIFIVMRIMSWQVTYHLAKELMTFASWCSCLAARITSAAIMTLSPNKWVAAFLHLAYFLILTSPFPRIAVKLILFLIRNVFPALYKVCSLLISRLQRRRRSRRR